MIILSTIDVSITKNVSLSIYKQTGEDMFLPIVEIQEQLPAHATLPIGGSTKLYQFAGLSTLMGFTSKDMPLEKEKTFRVELFRVDHTHPFTVAVSPDHQMKFQVDTNNGIEGFLLAMQVLVSDYQLNTFIQSHQYFAPMPGAPGESFLNLMHGFIDACLLSYAVGVVQV